MSVVAVLAASPVLAAIALDDLRHHRIRNRSVILLAIVTMLLVGALAFTDDVDVLRRAAFGAFLAAAPLAITWLAQPGGIGGGDVKLAAVLGALVGATNPWMGLAVAGLALLLSIVGAIGLRQRRIALAPGLALAAVVVVVVTA